jgi:hypothetical protein
MPPPAPAVPTAARRAPLAYAFVLLHPAPTLAFTLWAVDGLLHCDDSARVTCDLGFAVHLVFPAAVGVVAAVATGILGLTTHPATAARARLVLLTPLLPTLLTLWWALAITATPGPAPWHP